MDWLVSSYLFYAGWAGLTILCFIKASPRLMHFAGFLLLAGGMYTTTDFSNRLDTLVKNNTATAAALIGQRSEASEQRFQMLLDSERLNAYEEIVALQENQVAMSEFLIELFKSVAEIAEAEKVDEIERLNLVEMQSDIVKFRQDSGILRSEIEQAEEEIGAGLDALRASQRTFEAIQADVGKVDSEVFSLSVSVNWFQLWIILLATLQLSFGDLIFQRKKAA
jgi:hypothetical protein